MAGKMLSVEPTIDPSAKLHDVRLGTYCEVGARTILHEVTMDDYSYVVNDAQVTYTSIGKFCSIAAMTRINPGNHPMQRASQAHFTYRASTYFPQENDDTEFFAWRRSHHVLPDFRKLAAEDFLDKYAASGRTQTRQRSVVS